MRRDFREGTFLKDWLEDARRLRATFEAESAALGPDEREAAAVVAGFRTRRAYEACLRDMHRALELFADNAVFNAIWQALKDSDPNGDQLPWGFSAANAGVPRSILRAIEHWYMAPKFTASEHARHLAKIADAARKLIELVEQVSPGGVTEHFDRFDVDQGDAGRMLSAFRTPREARNAFRFDPDGPSAEAWSARLYLERAGITPLWALRQVEAAAHRVRSLEILPRKVRARSAYRTYMIGEVAQALAGMGSRNPLPVGDQVIADAVALLIHADCSLDDVRKALQDWRTEDSEARLKEIIHREM